MNSNSNIIKIWWVERLGVWVASVPDNTPKDQLDKLVTTWHEDFGTFKLVVIYGAVIVD